MIRGGTRIRLAAALVACCALSLAFVATALAKHSHSELTGAQSPAAEAGGSEASSTATSAAGSSESGADAPAASAPASAQTGSAEAGAQGASASGTSDSSDAQRAAGAQATHKKEATKSKRSHETALKGTGASKSGKGGAEGTGAAGEGEAAGTSTPTASESAPPTTAVAATPGASAPTASSADAPSTAAPASFSPSAASSTGTSFKSTAAARARHARGAHRAASARRHAATTSDSALDSLAPPAAFATPAALASSQPAAAAGPAPPRASSASKRHGPPSPLATTITRIVDVVPLAVRELIAALLALALLLGMRSRLAALRARRLERQRAQLLEDVGLLQAALLPDAPARLGPVGTSVAYRPADGPAAGGDFYDVFALADGQLAVIVGDVSGHGRQALPHTALVRFTLRAYLEAGLSPRDAVQTAGAVLERQLGGAFATVVVATYQPRERVLVYASAGHPPPIVLGVGAAPRTGVDTAAGVAARSLAPVTACASPPIGVGMRTGTRQTVVSVPGRALICFHTDGLTEARVGAELFGAERLLDTLAELAPDATAPELLARVAERSDARPDDMAACVLSVEGRDAAPAVLVEELELDRDDIAGARAERFLLACGLEPDELAAAAATARTAAARAGTAVLAVRHSGGAPPEVTVERERLVHISARRANAAVAL